MEQLHQQEATAVVLPFEAPRIEVIDGQRTNLGRLTSEQLQQLEQDARARMEDARLELMIVAEYRSQR